jgi:hypothetical protein
MACEHKFIHKETNRVKEQFCTSRCETWIQTDEYFCEKCLEEKTIKKEWCGQSHYSDRPDWTKVGSFKNILK